MPLSTLKNTRILLVLVSVLSNLCVADTFEIAAFEYPPYFDQNGHGMISDLYDEIFAHTDHEYAIKVYPINRGLKYFVDQTLDAHATGHVVYHENHHLDLDWTFSVTSGQFYYKPTRDLSNFSELSELSGLTSVDIRKGDTISRYERLGINVITVERADQQIRMVEAGRADMFRSTLLSGLLLIKKHFPLESGDFGFIPDGVISISLSTFKGHPKNKVMRGAYNVGLRKLIKNGRYYQVMTRYWGKDNVPKSILPPTLKSKGINEVDFNKFVEYPRDANLRILPVP